jgi:alkylation response protein AidB-like acyl-CoA dehydrogenase
MRAIGVAERALEMAIKRAKSRVAFGQRISEMGVTKAHVADMRMEIDMARLLVLKAAWAMDKFGNKEARQQIAMIKVAVPNMSTAACSCMARAASAKSSSWPACTPTSTRCAWPTAPSRPGRPSRDRQVQLSSSRPVTSD